MIERLLAAERALEAGELDKADRLFSQVADADARNAIAVVGLAEVAHRRGRRGEAAELVERALAIDPDDAAAERVRAVLSAAAPEEDGAAVAKREALAALAPEQTPSAEREAPAPGMEAAATPGRSLFARLRAWFRRGP